ncbi:MAG: efflux RND transporter periplasmic adaptor subunit [Planctomycetaceae bacterium]|nr:efflux RND transporter periplasmic adaptor subunit [Planctomycetaceae bacterium]
MSVVTQPPIRSFRLASRPTILLVVGAATVLVALWWALSEGPPSKGSGAASDPDEPKQEVVLSPAKMSAAGLKIEPCERRPLVNHRVVSGRIAYDEARHVTVRFPVDGVVREVLVKPGDAVQQGAVLAVINSPAVGTARADVMRRKAEWEIASRRAEWESQVATNVEDLVGLLKNRPPLTSVEQSVDRKTLGDYREKVISAYSRLLLAETLSKQLQSLAEQGIAEGRTVRERTSNRQVAESAFRAACEQAVFDARQNSTTSETAADDALRRLQIAESHLGTLIGRKEVETKSDGDSLSILEIRAPIAGTVEERRIAAAERIAAGADLFVVADSSRLWVAADIRERDWNVVSLRPGGEIQVQIPALGNRRFSATVHYIGRVVGEMTHTLPLVASIDNSRRELRPGMFARVSVPEASAQDAADVPAVRTAALFERDGQKCVFVETEPGRYRSTPVEVGRQSEEWTEVKTGVAPGDKVVVEGVFVLKSELLLEAEE